MIWKKVGKKLINCSTAGSGIQIPGSAFFRGLDPDAFFIYRIRNWLKGNEMSSSESGGGGNITIWKIYTPYLQCWNKNTFWTVFSSLCFHQYVLQQIVLPVYLHLQILPFLILGSIMSSAQLRPLGFKIFFCTIIIIQ